MLLYYLFRAKGVMPWEVYEQPPGYLDLVHALALCEMEDRAEARRQ